MTRAAGSGGIGVERNHRCATVGDDELGGDAVADTHLLVAAHHGHELGLRGLLEHVALQHDPIANPAGGCDVLGLVLRRGHCGRLVGDEHAHLLDGAQLQLVETLADGAGSDDDLDEVMDVARGIGAVHLGEPRAATSSACSSSWRRSLTRARSATPGGAATQRPGTAADCATSPCRSSATRASPTAALGSWHRWARSSTPVPPSPTSAR